MSISPVRVGPQGASVERLRPDGAPRRTRSSRHALEPLRHEEGILEQFRQSPKQAPAPARWSRAEMAGRLAEISGTAGSPVLTLAIGLVLDAQLSGETTAWIAAGRSLFFPVDVADSGIDLEALPVLRVPDVIAAGRAAEHLGRSGAFGLVVLDLGASKPLPMPLQARLVKLAQRYDTAFLCLTQKTSEERSLGSLVSLRAQVRRDRSAEGGYLCEARILKDKRRGPGWVHQESCNGPTG